ncbi:MAG TPA: hypothetical protein VM165_04430, partial [Planctomycetaceae bacterium]|nr:hypothetical protein [Planctomycetaceae bacterium]
MLIDAATTDPTLARAGGSEPFLPPLSSAEIPIPASLEDSTDTIRSVILTSGLLGGATVAEMVRRSVSLLPGHSARLVIPGPMTTATRAVRRLTCFDAAGVVGLGATNFDLRRFRCEQHSGWVARQALAVAERERPAEILHIIRQPQAYGLLRRMRKTPSLVYVDCSQRQARLEMPSRYSGWTYRPSVWWDGRVFAHARWVVAESDWVRRDLQSLYPESAAKCVTL